MSKVSKEKMVLHLPFDEEVGSTLAYNYAPNRTASNDATITGDCELTEDAVFGNALQINGENSECSVSQNLIEFEGEFTLTTFVKTTDDELTILMNFGNGGLYHSHTAAVRPSEWYFVAVQRVLIDSVYHTRFVLNRHVVLDEESPNVPTGLSIIDGSEENTSVVTIDELKIWNRGLSLTEIFTLQKEDEYLDFYVNGENFKLYGVEVSAANGLLDALERKDPLRVDWDSVHGEVIDLSRPHWNRREITLECFIVASSNTAFIRSLNRFLEAFAGAGTQRLTCEYAGSVKPLEYDVYRNDKVEVEHNWTEELKVGTFTISLIEPQPVKMVLKHICQSANSEVWLQCHSDKFLNVTWGDNDTTCQVDGESSARTKSSNLRSRNSATFTVRHTYATAGEYDIVIHGNIEDITDFTTNAIIIWSRL